MAKCFDVVGYVEPCNAVRQKYTGRAMLIYGSANEGLPVTFSHNGLEVSEMKGTQDFYSFLTVWKEASGKAFPITIYAENPFGVTVQGNTDSGRAMYTKTIPVSVPATRDGKAEEFIMGLQNGLLGNSIVVLETFGLDSTNFKNENDIFGTYSPVRIDPTSVTRSEYENGGAWNFNLVCEEPVPNVICLMTGLDDAINSLTA